MFVHFPNKVFRPYSCLGSRNLCGDNSRRTICFWQKKLITNVERKCRFPYLKPRPNDSLYRRSIIETEKTHLFEKRLCQLGKRIQNFRTGLQPGAPPFGPQRGAAPHPSRGFAPWNPNVALPRTPPEASPLGTPFQLFIFNYTLARRACTPHFPNSFPSLTHNYIGL